jgi:hypothetical protein
MTSDSKNQAARAQIITIAEEMVSGKMDLVSGARKLCNLRHAIGESENPVFFPIVGFESETDDYPVGGERQQYDSNQLQQLDKEIQEYVEQAKPSVLAACRRILEMLGP